MLLPRLLDPLLKSLISHSSFQSYTSQAMNKLNLWSQISEQISTIQISRANSRWLPWAPNGWHRWWLCYATSEEQVNCKVLMANDFPESMLSPMSFRVNTIHLSGRMEQSIPLLRPFHHPWRRSINTSKNHMLDNLDWSRHSDWQIMV